ncbi:STAS domain-containing protein [Magnetococcus sp. PR-3]|uniref:STAS domain-containing protein n=1 Tax=Magnetococcus sp. PR-3 TaxID=3120355 RepID=UPI002FCE1D6D
MDIQRIEEGDQIALVLKGELNHFAHQPFMKSIQTLQPNHTCTIHMDMVNTIDSAGLGMLLVLFEQMGSKPKKVKLCNPTPQVSGALKNSNFFSLFEVRDDCPIR